MPPDASAPLALLGSPAATWILWVVVVAVVVVALAEWPKRLWLKPSRFWRGARTQRDKLLLLSPLLAALGVLVGLPVFRAAGLVGSTPLGVALGAAVGGLSWAIYDVAVATIGLIPRIVRKKAGLDATTGSTEPVDAAAEVCGTSPAGADKTEPPRGAA